MSEQIIFIVIALIFEAFFSGSETALISMNLLRMEHLVEEKNRMALMARNLLKKPDKLLATTLVGTNLSVVIASSLATNIFTARYPKHGAVIAICVMTPIVLIFGELIPKTLCRYHPNKIALKISFPLRFFQKILGPLVYFTSWIANTLTRAFNLKGSQKHPLISKDEIQLAIKEISRQGILEEDEKLYIDRVFEFTLTKVGDIFVPLKHVISVDCKDSLEKIKEKTREYGFTRFPVFENNVIKGVINTYDVLYNQGTDWRTFLRPLRETHVDEHLDRLFALMQPNKESMAVVFKNKSIVGIVTMEDLVEEITAKIVTTETRKK